MVADVDQHAPSELGRRHLGAVGRPRGADLAPEALAEALRGEAIPQIVAPQADGVVVVQHVLGHAVPAVEGQELDRVGGAAGAAQVGRLGVGAIGGHRLVSASVTARRPRRPWATGER